MMKPEEPETTQPASNVRADSSVTDTQPIRTVRVAKQGRLMWVWLVVIPVLVLVVWGLAALMGYVVGLERREVNQVHMIAQASKEHFDLGVEDLLAGRFEFAKQRFEYVLSLDPQYPGAADLLGQAMEALNQPTITPSPVVSPTPSPTPDLSSYESVFQSAQAAYNQGDWSASLGLLLLLRGEAPTYKMLEVNQFMSELEMLAEVLVPGCRSTCGLSNVSNGSPEDLRPILNQTYMIMLEKLGMKACIVDAFDKGLHNIALGGRKDMVALVHQVMDGDDVDTGGLGKEAEDYVKTARVLLGHSLYSDSWLQL